MKRANVRDAANWFDVLLGTERTEAAVMRLDPGHSSSPAPSAHERSDQVLLVLEGAVDAQVGSERARLSRGDMVLIPAGTLHRISCAGDAPALTFNVYGPPAYGSGD